MTDADVHEMPETVEGMQQFRSQVGHISRHSGIFFAGTILSASLGYLFKVYLARMLGAQALGIYALGITLIGFMGVFNTLGLPQSATRFVASYQASGKYSELHRLIWRGAVLLLVANIVLAVALLTTGRFLAIRFYRSPALISFLPLFALLMLFRVESLFYGQVLAGYRDLKLRTLITDFVGTPLSMLIAVLLISAGLGLRGYLIAQVCGTAIVCMLLIIVVRHCTPIAARFSAQRGRYPERQVWSFSASMVCVSFLSFVISQLDKVALGFFRSARDVGIYSVAAALVAYIPLILTSVNQIFAPTIADLHTRQETLLLSRLFQSLTKWVTGLTLPGSLVVIFFARPIMRLFGPDFAPSWPILVIGTLGQLVNCGVGSVGFMLLMSGNEKRLIRVQCSMALVMFITTVALVPICGVIGAAIAAAITTAGINLWNLFEVHKHLGLTPYSRSSVKLLPPTVTTLALMLVLRSHPDLFHHDWLMIAVGLLVSYISFAAVYLCLGLDADDRLVAIAIRSRIQAAFL